MRLREKLELAGYRLRALAMHMPREWQKAEGLKWAEEAIASAIEAQRAETAQIGSVADESAVPKGDAHD